jgi:hypothetical protein
LISEPIQKWSYQDLRFVVETLVPERQDAEYVVDLIQDDAGLLEAMLHDDRLFQQLMDDEQGCLSVSPEFFFQVLLLRARRDLEQELQTIERRNLPRFALLDAQRVVDLAARPEVNDYLATMLASFRQIGSVSIPIRIRPGIWRRVRINDMDLDSLIRYAQFLEEEHRYGIYKRIADACLFLTGLFPEHIEAGRCYPQRDEPHLRLKSSLLHNLEEHEAYGRTFYRLASRHEMARTQALDQVLVTLTEQFVLAEKLLNFAATRYLSQRKHHLFDL